MLSYLADNLLQTLDYDEAVKHSYKDYHTKGLNYLCLHRNLALTIKLYYFREGEYKNNADNMLVNPHNHAYNFSTYCLFGTACNYNFEKIEGKGWHELEYATPLNPNGKETKMVGECDLRMVKRDKLWQNDNYTLHHDKIHSISVSAQQNTCLLLFQHADVPKWTTSLFMRKPEPPDLRGLYNRFTASELRDLVQELYRQF